MVLSGSGASSYGSDSFVNSKSSAASNESSGVYEGATVEGAGSAAVNTYGGNTTYSSNYSGTTGSYVQDQGTASATYNNGGSGVTTYSSAPATQ